MKKIVLILVIALLVYSCKNKPTEIPSENNEWSIQKREQYLTNRNDATTWDLEILKNDILFTGALDFGPFEFGAFPVTNYEITGKGSFKGMGSIGEEFQFNGKSILMNCFFVGNNEFNKNRLKELKDEIFFQVIVLTDTIDDINYKLNQRTPVSRNHPDYLGQGFVQTKNNRIDYVAFQTIENNSYAIINTRIFDLNLGKTILIAPQKDKSLRSLQIKSPQMSSDSIIHYTNQLLKDEKIMEFFKKEKNI